MIHSACLTCRHARKLRGEGLGQARCVLTGEAHDINDLCLAFWPLVDSFSRPLPSCSASTTATNSGTPENPGVF